MATPSDKPSECQLDDCKRVHDAAVGYGFGDLDGSTVRLLGGSASKDGRLLVMRHDLRRQNSSNDIAVND
ncbi:uncharacterized protein ARMOST_14058 [Armillaria ostoyae]|uniref:Uncharacterized protein n=1 Tax=Armillaria ostoyae TaxID=47428 RepID=A0A284RPI3_ARMOS|nr:uncharacterized protein ARMOST_14058 [Armillaria ostoyae]